MFRTRVALVMAGLIFAGPTLVVHTKAQPPLWEPGGLDGFRGDDRGERPGVNEFVESNGPESAGGFASDLFRLVSNETVQKELKLTDRQKAIIKRITDDQSKKRRDFCQELHKRSDAARTQAVQEVQAQVLAEAQVDPWGDARGWSADNPLYGVPNAHGYPPRIYGDHLEMDPMAPEQVAKLQGQVAGTAAQNESRQVMREGMEEFRQEFESALVRVLDRLQSKRLREILLQVEGAGAVLRGDVSAKLELREDQRDEIEHIVSQSHAASGELMRKNWDLVRSLIPATNIKQPTGDQTDNPPDGRDDPNGGCGLRHVDPEVLRSVMDRPMVKAKAEESLRELRRLRDREYALVYKAMDRRQVAAFKKMLGKPFDVDSVIASSFRGDPVGCQPGKIRAADRATAQAKPASSTLANPTPASSSPATTSKPAATPRRPSLRERRGLGGRQPSTDATQK